MEKKVVITGTGVINAISSNVSTFCDSLKKGRVGFGPISSFDVMNSPFKYGAEIVKFNPKDFFDSGDIKRLDRASQLSLVAAMEAVDQSGCFSNNSDPFRSGVLIGTTLGGMLSGQEFYRSFTKFNKRLPRKLIEYPLYRAGLQIAKKYNLCGPNIVVSTACSSGSMAISYGYDMIKSGLADLMIVGGVETFTELSWAGFSSLRIVSKTMCRPFDKRRDGLLLGEGAGILILESLQHALLRNARILGEVKGYCATSDAFHMTAPHKTGEGAIRSIMGALTQSGLTIDDIDYINAHGTGTPINDAMECSALEGVFKERVEQIPVSSTKSMIGHTLGAAGAIEMIACILAIRESFIPPTANFGLPDPKCRVDCVPNVSRGKKIRYALSNSFGFGGNNCSIIVGAGENHTISN